MGTHDVTETPRHSVSVAAAIFDESGENVLLIKRRDNGRWEPPGGVLELNETVEEGVRREVREETGGEIEIGPLTGVYKNMPQGIVALVFRAALIGHTATSTTEASAIAWHGTASLPDMPEAYSARIKDAMSRNSSPAIRAHNGTEILEAPTPSPGETGHNI